jgi:hypothetical protein
MARHYRVDGIEEPLSGEELVEVSKQLFDMENIHECSQCTRPRTIMKATWFLKNVIGVNVMSKLASENTWENVEVS